MINAPTAVKTYLASLPATVFYEDLYTFTLTSGQVLRLCSGTQSITIGGHTFTSYAPDAFIDRANVKMSIGLKFDSVRVIIRADPSAQVISGVPFMAEFVAGYFDGAAVLVERLFMPTYGDVSLGTYKHFVGTIGEIIEITQAMVEFVVNSPVELLNQPLPRNLFSPSCRHALYDAGCLLTRASFAVAGTALTGSNKSQIIATMTQLATSPAPAGAPSLSHTSPSGVNLTPRIEFAVITYVYSNGESLQSPESNIHLDYKDITNVASPPSATGVIGWNCYIGDSPGNEMLQNATPIAIGTPFVVGVAGITQGSPPPEVDTSGYFSLGVIEFTSGPNAGQSRSVSTYVDGLSGNKILNIVPPLPQFPVAGNTFNVYPGCDKRMSTCGTKYNNLIHFGGFPWIPEPTSAV